MSYGLGIGPIGFGGGKSLEQLAKEAQDTLVDSLPLPGSGRSVSTPDGVQVMPEIVVKPKLSWVPFVIAGLAFWFLSGNRKIGRGSLWE